MRNLNTFYEGANCETCALEHWDFCAKNVDNACDSLDWLAWDTYELRQVVLILTSHPLVCEFWHCSAYNRNFCPRYISANGFARLVNMI